MTSENVNLDQIKKAWQVMGESLGSKPTHGSNPENLQNKKTALDRLRDKYGVFRAIALLMTFPSFMIFSRGVFVDNTLNLYLGVAYAVYFLTCFFMDQWLWIGVGTIDPLRMGVSQVAEKAAHYKKRHLQFVTILIPMAIVLLGFTGYVFSADKYFLIGMATGAVVGAIIGTSQFRRFMAEYRKLIE